MPVICRFEGIVVTMYREVGVHERPHFHVRYAEYRASISIEPLELLAGTLPRRQTRLVWDWAQRRQADLFANWQRLERDEPPVMIATL